MAEHTLAILVKAIGAAKAANDLRGVDKAVSNIGASAGKGLRNAASNLGKVGAVGLAGLSLAIHSGLEDLATLESAVSSVDGAIKQMGQTGKVTGKQVADWANQIEADVGAAFDDKDITRATATLIRFGKVTPQNLRPAMVVMTDLAVKTGDVDSAASLLAKAMADPTKAAGKLARVGIILTKSQQDQIKALTKAGKTAQAQKIILDALAKSTKGAAAASQGPYQRAISTLKDVSEDARKALAEGFLPVIEKVATLLSKELAKPEVMANIREFGKGLASGLDSLIAIAQKLPWSTIGDSIKLAGTGAKIVLEAFTAMPPWIQTAVLTGWGLNKLTGGALGDIVGEVGKGLIKGVLGMNAGVVNIKAGVVNGAGGGVGAVGGKGGGLASAIGKVFIVGAAAGAFLELKGIFDEQNAANKAAGAALVNQATGFGASAAKTGDTGAIVKALTEVNRQLERGRTEVSAEGAAIQFNIGGVRDSLLATKAKLDADLQRSLQAQLGAVTATDRVRDRVESNKIATITAGNKTAGATAAVGSAIQAAKNATVSAVHASGLTAKSGGLAAAAAIRAKDMKVHLRNTVNVSVPVSIRAIGLAKVYAQGYNPVSRTSNVAF